MDKTMFESANATDVAARLSQMLPTEQWYYEDGNRLIGPISAESMAELVRMGYAKPSALARTHDGQAKPIAQYPQWASIQANPFAGMPSVVSMGRGGSGSSMAGSVMDEIGRKTPTMIGRSLALLLDWFIMVMAQAAMVVPVLLFSTVASFDLSFLKAFLISAGIYISYSAFSEASKAGATLGKRMVGLRVVSESNKPIGLARSLLRSTVKAVSCCVLPISALFTLSRDDRRALHDIIAKTKVVRK